MSLLDKLKSFFGGSQSATSDAPAVGESTTSDTHEGHDHEGHDHEGHDHSHDPVADKPAEPTH